MKRLQTIKESLTISSVDQSDAPECCAYCGEPGDLRPYGKDGAWICCPCGMEPENIADTEAKFAEILKGNGGPGIEVTSLKEAMDTKLVKAKDLKVGDYLPFTKSTVVVAPSAGLKTPSGKIDLTVESNGKRYSKTWNKNTEISVAIKNEE